MYLYTLLSSLMISSGVFFSHEEFSYFKYLARQEYVSVQLLHFFISRNIELLMNTLYMQMKRRFILTMLCVVETFQIEILTRSVVSSGCLAV